MSATFPTRFRALANLPVALLRAYIYLIFLAPDIVQRIIRGERPLEWNAARLIHAVPLPLDWDQQRARLGRIS
jgi:site-specific DNA recombinase